VSDSEERLIQRIRDRADEGLLINGITMECTDLSLYEWLLNACEECLDLALYLERVDAINAHDDVLQLFIETYRNILIDAAMQLEFFVTKYTPITDDADMNK